MKVFFECNYAAWHLAGCILHVTVDRGIDEAGVHDNSVSDELVISLRCMSF